MAEEKRGIYFIEKIAHDAYKIYERREAAMYLVCGKDKACLIDTAYGLTDLKELVRTLTDLPVTVLNTHGHVDHVLGNHWFYDDGRGQAFLHPADRFMYEEIAGGYAQMLSQPWVQEAYGEFARAIDPSKVHFPKVEDIREGDIIDLGGKILEVIEIPGHTPGSILLLDRADKICYSGDSLVEKLWLFLQESQPPEVFLAALRHAYDALSSCGIEKIYNGHFAHVPLTLPMVKNMIFGMEQILSGKAEGVPFEFDKGKGIEYTFGEWSVLLRESAFHEAKI